MPVTIPAKALRHAALLLALVAALPQALARGSFELRAFSLATFTSSPFATGQDLFTNGNPTAGLVFQTSGGTVAGMYGTGNGSFTGAAERSGAAPDFLGQQFGAGGLSFRYGDAGNATSNLTPAPYESRSLSLATAAVPSTALGLVDSQKGFEVDALWNFPALSAGESLILGLGGSSAGPGSDGANNYRDRLQIRLTTTLAGTSLLNFERQTRQDGVFTRTALESHALSSLPVDLAQVDYLYLQFWRGAPTPSDPNPGVAASVYFMDAAYDPVQDNPVVLYTFSFAATGTTFLDSRFSSVFNAASWLNPDPAAVPEPAQALLLVAGLALLAARRRRRR